MSRLAQDASDVQTIDDLAQLLRRLRRREARRRGATELTYRELAARTGWSHGIIGEYLNGKALPPTERFDRLTQQLGAAPSERGALATARDRVEEHRRQPTVRAANGALRAPQQLPATIAGFVGRVEQLAALDHLMTTMDRRQAVVISAVSGTAGVGKTALALHWAHRVAHRFPDGQLYVNLRGFEPTGSAMAPGEVLPGFLDALQVAPAGAGTTLDSLAGQYRSQLAGKRVLVVLDNARDAEQVRPLLPGTSGCLAIITSRSRLPGLLASEGAHPLPVDLLSQAEARELLGQRLGAERVAAEPEAVDEIIEQCARLPLALAIVAARAATHPQFALRDLAGQLRAGPPGLTAFTGGDHGSNLRAVFSWSYRRLSPVAARLFRLLGVHPGREAGSAAVASLAGMPPAQVWPALAELADAHLVAEPRPGRFTCHDLLHTYASELAHTIDSEAERRSAVRRALEHYLHTAHSAALLVNASRSQASLPPPSRGVEVEPLGTLREAMDWFTTERQVLLAAAEQTTDPSYGISTWQFAYAMIDFLERQGYLDDLVTVQESALRAAQPLQDRQGEASARRGLGRAYAGLRRYAEAETHYQRALKLHRELDDRRGQAYCRHGLALVYGNAGRHREALGCAEHALALYRAIDDDIGHPRALNTIGWIRAMLGDYPAALRLCGQAVTRQERSGDRRGEAATWKSLGYAHHHHGQPDRAVAAYRRALERYRGLGDRFREAETLINLGDSSAATEPELARQCWRQALDLMEQLGHPATAEVRARMAPSPHPVERAGGRKSDHPIGSRP